MRSAAARLESTRVVRGIAASALMHYHFAYADDNPRRIPEVLSSFLATAIISAC
jgi:hypothetical protein